MVLLLPTFTYALALNLDYPKFGPFDLNTNQNLSEIIAYAYYFIVGIAGLAAFVMLVWGGVQWLASGAVPSQAAEARDKVRNAILGLLLVLASFLIIQIINPELTILSGKPYPPIECSTLGNACNRLSLVFGRAGYRCEPLGGIGNNFSCSGTPPLAPGRSEACVQITRLNSAGNIVTGSCINQCRTAGGESARFNEEHWFCCNAPTATQICNNLGDDISTVAASPITPLMQSFMRSQPGVYGCDDDGCLQAWRRFVSDTSDVCDDPVFDSSPRDDDLCRQIGSLWIHGPYVAVLYEGRRYAGRHICFDGRTNASPPGRLINRLDDYEIESGNGWNTDTDSIRILQDGNPEIASICPVPMERTLP